MLAEEVLHTAPRVRRMVVAADAAEADIGRAVVEDIGLAVEEGIVLEADIDPGAAEHHTTVAGDMDYVLEEGVEGGSHAVVAAGRTGPEVGSPEVGRSLEEALVVVERRSPVVADILVGDTGRPEAADIQVEGNGPRNRDSHLEVEDTTYFSKTVH